LIADNNPNADKNPFVEFVNRFGPPAGEEGPVNFCREVLGVDPDDWQLVVLRAYGRGERKISIASCHGPGKTAVAAWVTVHQLVCRFPQKTAVTAPSKGQMYDAYYAELVKWMNKLPPAILSLYDIRTERITLKAAPKESFVSVRTAKADQPEALQGIHCDDGWVLMIADEASGVPEKVFEAAIGSMSGENVTTLLLSNPVRSQGYFFNSQTSTKGWIRLRITAVPPSDGETLDENEYYSERPGAKFVQDVIDEYGLDSNAYRIRALGLFPKSDDDTIIPFELVDAALTRDVVGYSRSPIVWGVDVARGGGDLSTLAKRQAYMQLERVKVLPESRDIMIVTGWIKAEWDMTPLDSRPEEICVDVIGVGAGVADRLRELGLPARGINVSENSALNRQRFRNLRTELWFKMQEWFRARNCKIFKDDKLIAELVGQKYKIIESNGKVWALGKDDMRKHLRRSPDRADAFMLTFAGNALAAMFGGKQKSWDKPLRRKIKGVV